MLYLYVPGPSDCVADHQIPHELRIAAADHEGADDPLDVIVPTVERIHDKGVQVNGVSILLSSARREDDTCVSSSVEPPGELLNDFRRE